METLRYRDWPMRAYPDACGMGQRHPRLACAQGGGRRRPSGPRGARAPFHSRQSPCYPLKVASNISAASLPMRPSLPPRCSTLTARHRAAVAGPNGKSARKRYSVYRNNVTVSLINALAAVFPATMRITGVDFFRAMARFHVRATPPTSPLLFEYGHDFADFIERYQYAKSMPWLADVARIERAWLDAYHAADVEALAPQVLASIPPERLAEAVLTPHPATRIVCSRFPALMIFAANRSDGPVGRIAATAAGGCAGDQARPGGYCPATSTRRGGLPEAPHRRRTARRGRRGSACGQSGIRSLYQHCRSARGRCFHHGQLGRPRTMTVERQISSGSKWQRNWRAL